MASKRPPNPNTAYGRKRMREEYPQNLARMTPEERQQHDSDKTTVTAILWGFAIVSCLIAFAVSGGDGLLKWMKYLTNQ